MKVYFQIDPQITASIIRKNDDFAAKSTSFLAIMHRLVSSKNSVNKEVIQAEENPLQNLRKKVHFYKLPRDSAVRNATDECFLESILCTQKVFSRNYLERLLSEDKLNLIDLEASIAIKNFDQHVDFSIYFEWSAVEVDRRFAIIISFINYLLSELNSSQKNQI